MRAERGAGGLFALVVITLAMIAVLALVVLFRVTTNVSDATQTMANLKTAAAALEQFAGASGRLPCPADPSTDNGLASPAGASRDCDFTQGTLPWATIGMRRDDAYDAWGWKISYRVYSNTNGSLTQAKGASMVDCDTVQALNPQPVDGTGLCPVAHDTLDTAFLAGKGLTVTDFGTTINGASSTGGAAYVLISHGSTGLGAWTSAGVQKDNPKSTEEKNNMKDTGPFTLMAASGPEVPATDNNHFDDILFYRTVLDLAKKANLAARDWPNDDVTSSVLFDRSTLTTALGGSDPRGNGGNTGQSTISLPFMTATGFDSTGGRSISFTSGASGNPDAIGVVDAGGGGNNLTSTGGDGLRFDLASDSRQISTSLANFTSNERAELRFYELNRATNVATLVSTVNQAACGTAGVASFTIDPGVAFNRVEIRPVIRLDSTASSFLVAEIRTCIQGVTCRTTLYTSGDQC